MKLFGVYIASSAVSAFNPLHLLPKVTPSTRDDCQDFWYELRGQNYIGNKDYTVSGRTCQKWSAKWPHDHSQPVLPESEDPYYPYGFCRNPGKELAKLCRTHLCKLLLTL